MCSCPHAAATELQYNEAFVCFRVATVLARVRDMTDTAEEYRQEVIRLKSKLAETQQVMLLACRRAPFSENACIYD